MSENYPFKSVVLAGIVGAATLFSNLSLAQCTVSAGDDFATCDTEGVQLTGSYTFVPEVALDENQTNTCMAFFSQGDLAQSFTATTSASCGAGLYFDGAATGSLTISLWSNLPTLGGVQLATGTSMLSNQTDGNVYWPSVSLTPGNQYFLVFTSTGAPITACIAGSTANPYAGGTLYANAGFNEFATYDYTFRVFSCESAISIEWTGPNIESGANTANATVNPSVGTNTYTFTMTDASSGCTVSDEVVVTVNEVSNLATTTNGLTITAVNENATYQWVDCDNGNALISGAIAQTFTAVANGNYAVELTENGCVATSDCVAITTVSLNELSQHVITVMPNPNNGVFTLKADVTGLSYNLMDSQGRLISSGVTTENQTAFSIENEANGVYFLRVENEVLKLIKQ